MYDIGYERPDNSQQPPASGLGQSKLRVEGYETTAEKAGADNGRHVFAPAEAVESGLSNGHDPVHRRPPDAGRRQDAERAVQAIVGAD
jgi:hypothetical protein